VKEKLSPESIPIIDVRHHPKKEKEEEGQSGD
jgi:hypothetical protein